nr:MAG TPA: hypothetical protein [Caudoviricetes sp.]
MSIIFLKYRRTYSSSIVISAAMLPHYVDKLKAYL